jgi:hypothetical protein
MKIKWLILGALLLIGVAGIGVTMMPRKSHHQSGAAGGAQQTSSKPKNGKLKRANLNHANLKNGDIVFQASSNEALELATKSTYTHCGVLFEQNGEWFVFEAVQPVKMTPLEKWIARNKDKHLVIKRLQNADAVLTQDVLQQMKAIGKTWLGKNYDVQFMWSDENLYCSELVWKLYERTTGIELAKLQHLRDYDLSSDVVKEELRDRYGKKVPLDELVITPVALFESSLLTTVDGIL